MENAYFNTYDVLCLFGSFLSLLLGCILVFNEKFRTRSNIALAICLFSLALAIFRDIISSLECVTTDSFIIYAPIFYALLIPLGLYFNINYLMNPNYQLKQRDYWLIAPMFLIIITDIGFLYAYLFHPSFLKANPRIIFWYGNFIYNFLAILYFLIILPLNWKKITQYQSSLLNNFSSIEGKDLQWLKDSTKITAFILFVLIFLKFHTEFSSDFPKSLFYILWLLATAFICLIAFRFIINQNFYLVPHFKEKIEDKDQPNVLSEKTDEHYQNLLYLMETEKLYQDAELNMNMLAEKMQLSKGYLSRIINQKENKNFYDFVNTFRVEEVKRHLNDPDYAHYSILGIGLEAGFKSKSTFNTVFKKMTKMTPSNYKKQL